MIDETLRGAVLAAGLGTRLRPLTAHLPKPLVPLMGRPLVDRAISSLVQAGVQHIGVNAHHAGQALIDHLHGRATVVSEPILRGTGGGIAGIATALGGTQTLIAINGDALFDFPIGPALKAHRRRGAMATLVLRPTQPGDPFARVGVDGDDMVCRISEVHGPRAQHVTRFGAFTGVQIIEQPILAAVPSGESDIFRSAYRQHMEQGAPIAAYFVPATFEWLDVGTVGRYLDAHQLLLEGRVSAPDLVPADSRGRRVHPSAAVDPTAQLEGPCALAAGVRVEAHARIGPGCYIGAGAHIRANADLERVVVWANAVASGRLRDTVIMD